MSDELVVRLADAAESIGEEGRAWWAVFPSNRSTCEPCRVDDETHRAGLQDVQSGAFAEFERRPRDISETVPKLEAWIRGRGGIAFESRWFRNDTRWCADYRDHQGYIGEGIALDEQTARAEAALAALEKIKPTKEAMV